jgi:transposase
MTRKFAVAINLCRLLMPWTAPPPARECRFVPTKTVEQQSCLMLHRARHLFVRQQTAVINSIRAYLADSGSLLPSATEASSNCWKSSPIQLTVGSRKWPAHVLRLSSVSCGT